MWALLAAALGLSVFGLVISLPFRIGGEPTMESFALVGMSGGLGLAVVLMTAAANRGIDDWTQARELTVWSFVFLIAIPIGGLAIGIVLGRTLHPLKEIVPTEGPVIAVAAGERVSWVGRVRVKWVLFVMGGVALILLLTFPELPLWVFLAVIGVGLMMTQVEANVTNDGLRIRLGGIPVKSYGLDGISTARAIDLDPREWGGWGWRFAPNRSAIVLRGGEAIELTLRSGRLFAVTVDEATTGAALLNGLIGRSQAES